MSKRRSRRSGATRTRQIQAVRQTQTVRQTKVAVAAPEPQTSGPVDFSVEYRYVLGDLRRFAILAVAMFATLVVLALVLG